MNIDFLNTVYLNNPVNSYLTGAVTLIAGVLIIKLATVLLLRRLKVWAQRTKTSLDDFIVRLLEKIIIPLAYIGVLYLSLKTLTLHPLFEKTVHIAGIAILTLFVARFLSEIIGHGFRAYTRSREKNVALEHSLEGILRVIKVIIWGVALIFFLDNIGFKISTVIAGLGIGGIAVGLAAQAVLKDLFSYFSILFDRPFEVGDFIIVGEYLGTVEYIGAKTTRIRSLSGEQLIFSNTDLTDSRLRNYKRMSRRRVVFKLGVTYQTTLEQMKEIPKVIKTIIQDVKDTSFDRAHFLSYGDFSLIVEVVYYVEDPDYNKYMDIQQEINFAIKEAFEKKNIEFAYPTQTVLLEKQG